MSYKSDIIHACFSGNPSKLTELLKARTEDELTDLALSAYLQHICSKNGQAKCLELVFNHLLLSQHELDTLDEEGKACIHHAAESEHQAVCRTLLELGADGDLTCGDGYTALCLAIVNGRTTIVSELLHKVDVSCPDAFGVLPLHYAVQACTDRPNIRTQLVILGQLLSHPNININGRDSEGRTPLIWAASAGAISAVDKLLTASADVNIVDNQNLTALHCAANQGYSDVIECLFRRGNCDMNQEDNFGCTALFYAVSRRHKDTMRRLISLGVNLDHQDKKGRSVAHCAAANGLPDFLYALEREGCNLWLVSKAGEYPVHESIQKHHIDTAFHLLNRTESTTDINRANRRGLTLLHMACIRGSESLVTYLVDRSADVNTIYSSKKGQYTALDICDEKGHQECSRLLRKSGAKSARTSPDKSSHPASPVRTDKLREERKVTIDKRPYEACLFRPNEKMDKTAKPRSESKAKSGRKPTQLQESQRRNSQVIPNRSPGTSQSKPVLINPETSGHGEAQAAANPQQTDESSPGNQQETSHNEQRPENRRQSEEDRLSYQPEENRISHQPEGNRVSHPLLRAGTDQPPMSAKPRSPRPKTSCSKNPLQASKLPYSEVDDGGWATSFININSTIKRPRSTLDDLRRRTSTPTRKLMKKKILDSVSNYEAIRSVARMIQDGYSAKPRPITARPLSTNPSRCAMAHRRHGSTSTDEHSSTDDGQKTRDVASSTGDQIPKYTVIATRGGFTKIRNTLPSAHPTKSRTAAVQSLTTGRGNMSFTQGYDGRLRIRSTLNPRLPSINET